MYFDRKKNHAENMKNYFKGFIIVHHGAHVNTSYFFVVNKYEKIAKHIRIYYYCNSLQNLTQIQIALLLAGPYKRRGREENGKQQGAVFPVQVILIGAHTGYF